MTSNKKRQGAAIFVVDRHRSATPWQPSFYQKIVHAEKIIASELPKSFASQILVKFFVLILADLSTRGILDLPG